MLALLRYYYRHLPMSPHFTKQADDIQGKSNFFEKIAHFWGIVHLTKHRDFSAKSTSENGQHALAYLLCVGWHILRICGSIAYSANGFLLYIRYMAYSLFVEMNLFRLNTKRNGGY